jgi:CRISPR-associated protein Cas2
VVNGFVFAFLRALRVSVVSVSKAVLRISPGVGGKLAVLPIGARGFHTVRMFDPARTLYLVCYDVADRRRLYRVHKFLAGYKVGGQKSFFECWLTAGELARVREGLRDRMDAVEDRAHIFQLDPRQRVQCFGAARPTPEFFAIL